MTEPALHRSVEILAKAEGLFAQRGYHATSVRDIAEALDIKAGSLYSHIDAKENLLWEMLNAAADRFFAAVKPIERSDLIPIEKLRRGIAAHVKVITDNVTSASVYSTQWRHLAEPRRSEFTARRDDYEKMFRNLLRDCIRSGAIADVDEKFATLLILSSINWIYQWYKVDGPMTSEEIARKLTDMFLNGLRRGT